MIKTLILSMLLSIYPVKKIGVYAEYIGSKQFKYESSIAAIMPKLQTFCGDEIDYFYGRQLAFGMGCSGRQLNNPINNVVIHRNDPAAYRQRYPARHIGA